jgi:hypothetical protein
MPRGNATNAKRKGRSTTNTVEIAAKANFARSLRRLYLRQLLKVFRSIGFAVSLSMTLSATLRLLH